MERMSSYHSEGFEVFCDSDGDYFIKSNTDDNPSDFGFMTLESLGPGAALSIGIDKLFELHELLTRVIDSNHWSGFEIK